MKPKPYTLLVLLVAVPFLSLAQTQHPSLSSKAEQLRVHLGWLWPTSNSNVVFQLPEIGSVTNILSDGTTVWRDPISTDYHNAIPLVVLRNGCQYSANVMCFNDPDEAMKDMLEGTVLNAMPFSLIVDHCTTLTTSVDKCQAMVIDSINGSLHSSVHCILGSLQLHLFASSPGSSNLVDVANTLCDWLRLEEP